MTTVYRATLLPPCGAIQHKTVKKVGGVLLKLTELFRYKLSQAKK